MTVLAIDEVENVIIGLLAEQENSSPEELRERLAKEGPELPVDSLIVVEVLVRVEEAFGVTVPETVDSARSLRSVRAFAELIVDLVRKSTVEDSDG
jgi:acyl carrier protein